MDSYIDPKGSLWAYMSLREVPDENSLAQTGLYSENMTEGAKLRFSKVWGRPKCNQIPQIHSKLGASGDVLPLKFFGIV